MLMEEKELTEVRDEISTFEGNNSVYVAARGSIAPIIPSFSDIEKHMLPLLMHACNQGGNLLQWYHH